MNLFDLVVVVLVAVAMLIGFRSGALPQISGLIGAVGGGVVAVLALPYFESSLEGLEPQLRAFAVLAGIRFSVEGRVACVTRATTNRFIIAGEGRTTAAARASS